MCGRVRFGAEVLVLLHGAAVKCVAACRVLRGVAARCVAVCALELGC